MEIFLKTNDERLDVSEEEKNGYEYHLTKKQCGEDPIYTQLTFLTEKHTTEALYKMVLRKLFIVSSLAQSQIY